MAELTPRQMSKELARYEKLCASEIDNYNRERDTDYTITEARKHDLLTHRTFDDYLDSKYPDRVAQRRKRQAQRQARADFLNKPLSERIRYQAVSELAGALRVHAENLKEIEAVLEAELEEENGMGMF